MVAVRCIITSKEPAGKQRDRDTKDGRKDDGCESGTAVLYGIRLEAGRIRRNHERIHRVIQNTERDVRSGDHQCDAAAEELSFRIKSDEGHYISFKSMAVWLIAARPDGVIYEIAGMIKDWDPGDATYLEFKMIKGLTDVPGDVICEIAWIFPSGSVGNQAASIQRATQNFILRVEPSPKAIYGNKNTVIDDSGGGRIRHSIGWSSRHHRQRPSTTRATHSILQGWWSIWKNTPTHRAYWRQQTSQHSARTNRQQAQP